MTDDDVLSGFERVTFTADGKTRDVFRIGSGPAVVVIAEMPGITPKVAGFARTVADNGMTAVMPHLFGVPGRAFNPGPGSIVNLVKVAVPLCVSREFVLFATGRTSPVVSWLRALAASEHERCGGPGVGAIGMCLTGGFALGMAVDERLLAPVLAQPSTPLPIGRKRQRTIDTSPADLNVVKDRCASGLEVMGLRFTSDRLVGPHRFEFLREQLGDAFIAVELAKEDANPASPLAPHSVLTEHLVDEPGTPTRDALDDVLRFFRTKLGVAS